MFPILVGIHWLLDELALLGHRDLLLLAKHRPRGVCRLVSFYRLGSDFGSFGKFGLLHPR